VSEELGSADRICGSSLTGREFVASEVLVDLDREAVEVWDMLEIDLELLEGIEALPVMGTDGAELAALLLGLGEALPLATRPHRPHLCPGKRLRQLEEV